MFGSLSKSWIPNRICKIFISKNQINFYKLHSLTNQTVKMIGESIVLTTNKIILISYISFNLFQHLAESPWLMAVSLAGSNTLSLFWDIMPWPHSSLTNSSDHNSGNITPFSLWTENFLVLIVKSTYVSDLLIETSNATKRWFMTVTLDFHWKAKVMIEIPPAASQVQNTKGTRKETIINYYYSQLLCAMWLVDLMVRVLKYGPLDSVVSFPAGFNFQEI